MSDSQAAPAGPGPPPLEPFGLILHRDASWTHEGIPILNRRLRARFDRAVVYLPDEQKYIVQIGRFRAQIEIEEVGFFVRSVDFESGALSLSDRSSEPFDPSSLRPSSDGQALLCSVKRDLEARGLPALFTHAAQAELLHAIEEVDGALMLELAGVRHRLPAALGRV
jgi:hypothetical protein